MRDNAAIEKVVRDTISRDFNNVRILRVTLREGGEDDDVLRIDVIFEGTPKDIDARKLSGFVRSVRPKLIEMGEYAFPLMSFISKSDVGSTKLAPA